MAKKNKEIELRSEQVQEILEKVPHWMIRWGNTLVLLLLVMLLFITWFVKYPDIINAEAVVTTKIPPQKEYAKTSGTFDAILVENNQIVIRNQPLAIIENNANYKDVLQLSAIIDTITVNTKSFMFPLDSLPVLFLGDIESQYALFENSYIQYQLNKELQPFANENLANNYSISELNRRLKSLQSQKEINENELNFVKKDLQRNKLLFEKGVISAQEYDRKQIEYAQSERNYKNFESSISQIKEGISGANRTTKGTKINQIKEEMMLLKNVIQTFNQLKTAVRNWKSQYLLQSNINGKVSFLNYWSKNQNVEQGKLVFTIIPTENSSFIAKLKTPAQNSGKLNVGQKVKISLESYPETEFGVVNGVINYISAVPDSEGFYLLDVDLPKTLITSYNKELDFKQEMRGNAEIITEDLRLMERFFYQIKDIFK